MKKLLFLFTVSIALISCGEDVRFNNQAVFQGVKDNIFWQGSDAKAILGSNKLKIQAVSLTETMVLEIPIPSTSIDPKNENTFATYVLGTSTNKKASFVTTIADEVYEYQTGVQGDVGEVVVSQYDGVTVSGTFRFNAKNIDPTSTGNEFVNMQNGVFYKVPVTPEL